MRKFKNKARRKEGGKEKKKGKIDKEKKIDERRKEIEMKRNEKPNKNCRDNGIQHNINTKKTGWGHAGLLKAKRGLQAR